MTSSEGRKTIRGEVVVAIAGLGVVVLLALLRQPAGPVIAPVIIQGQGHRVQATGEDAAASGHAPGEPCVVGGVYRPVGELRRGRKPLRPRVVAVGEPFPGLPGYADGAVWVRE